MENSRFCGAGGGGGGAWGQRGDCSASLKHSGPFRVAAGSPCGAPAPCPLVESPQRVLSWASAAVPTGAQLPVSVLGTPQLLGDRAPGASGKGWYSERERSGCQDQEAVREGVTERFGLLCCRQACEVQEERSARVDRDVDRWREHVLEMVACLGDHRVRGSEGSGFSGAGVQGEAAAACKPDKGPPSLG